MAKGEYISINSNTIAAASAKASAVGNQMETTQGELKTLQKRLRESLFKVDLGVSLENVVPIRELNKQQKTMDSVVSLMAQASQLAENANKGLTNEAEAMRLAIKVMTVASTTITSALSVIVRGITGDKGGADERVSIGGWGPTPEELEQRNTDFLAKNNRNGAYYAGKNCVKLTYDKLKAYMTDGKSPQYAKRYTSSGNGKDVYDHLADTTGRTDLPFTQTKYGGENCLKQLVSSAGDPVTDIIVSFPTTKNKDGTINTTYGHVVYIDAIIDGKVYVTDTYAPSVTDPVTKKVKTGAEVLRVYDSIDAFVKNYKSWGNGKPIGAVHFQKNS